MKILDALKEIFKTEKFDSTLLKEIEKLTEESKKAVHHYEENLTASKKNSFGESLEVKDIPNIEQMQKIKAEDLEKGKKEQKKQEEKTQKQDEELTR